MLIVKMWHYFKGYVIIKIEGFALEKFLNLVVKEGIFTWDIFRESNTVLYIKVSKHDFKRMRNIIKKASCRLEIIDKRGLPFILGKMRKRKFFVGGAVIVLALIYFLTSFIWTVEVKESKSISKTEILGQLKELGLQRGTLKYKFDEKEVGEKLLLNNPKLSYVNIEIKGTKAEIAIIEKEQPPEMIDVTTPTHVVAKKDGIIHQILVFGGEAVVTEGQLVRKGDVLISGELTVGEEEIQRVHARGDIFAKTWYEEIVDIPTEVAPAIETKEMATENLLVVGKKEFTLKKANISDEKYDKIIETIPDFNKLKFKFPLYIKKIKYSPKQEQKVLTESEIKEKALKQVKEHIEKEIGENIQVSKNTVEIISHKENTARVKVFIEAIEKISIMKEIN